MTDLDEFLDVVDETCINSIGLSRVVDDNPEDAQIAMLLTTEESLDGATVVVTGSVGNRQDHVTVAIRAFQNGAAADVEVLTLGNEVIVTMKNPIA